MASSLAKRQKKDGRLGHRRVIMLQFGIAMNVASVAPSEDIVTRSAQSSAPSSFG